MKVCWNPQKCVKPGITPQISLYWNESDQIQHRHHRFPCSDISAYYGTTMLFI